MPRENIMPDIALYPSCTHLLPEGKAEIILWEDRHLRMLKQALAEERPFALCMLNETDLDNEIKQIPAIATQCQVINFDRMDNGLLNIQVEGIQKIRLLNVKIEHDDLLSGHFTLYPNWQPQIRETRDDELAEKLVHLFSTMPEIGTLYPHPKLDDLSWVCQRWIEILPLEVRYKQLLITQDNAKLTSRFLHKLFLAD
ncbi:LON peptidase substrate-binding domain-containing protein [Photobacterium nomapromontoriensis]|uniref:LON peptidase substrate-binding domain-containing protein n=1 Tax=Photobacterium nomapromontoriensis TaxID=2910237 RepID=UPI003D11DE97